ncbi:hypothetical protein ACFL52_01535 [Candidatus Margulisiibacteriota bacterium]
MAEENFNPQKEGERIAKSYLSSLGWVKAAQRNVWSKLSPTEDDFKAADTGLDNAEAILSSGFDKWHNDPNPQAKAVLFGMYKVLKNRNDLGFIGKRIVDRLRRMF